MIGETISHYRITGQLGRGGMGIVYQAEDTKLDRTVAIKVLPPAALVTEDDRARFYREAKAAAQLTHPNIAAVYEIDEAVPSNAPHGSQPSPFIAMEYIAGGTLGDLIASGPLKLKDVVRIGSEVAEALRAAHGKEIVHRDVKSSNVMLDADRRAKVLDFGLAKTTHSTLLTQMGSTLGTVAYMSPEQARGEDVDYRSDLWSLGILLYEMVAGRLPYGGDYEQAVVYAILNESPEPLTAVRSGVPMTLEWIVSKCLAKDPADRYQSASDLIVDLRNVDTTSSRVTQVSVPSTGQLSAVAAPAPPEEQPAGPLKRWLKAWPVALGALLAGLAAGYGLFAGSGPDAANEPLLRVEIPLPSMRYVRFPALSPTRGYLAVVGSDTLDRTGIFLRDMSSGEMRHLEGTANAGAREIKFSPDGTRLAFTADANSGVFTVVLPSGLPERQTELGRLIYWEDTETILYLDDAPGGKTYRKRLGQGESEEIPLEDPTLTEELVDIIKTGIPGSDLAFGHQFVRTAGGAYTGVSKVFSANLASGRVEILESEVMNPEYVSGGFLTYQMRGDEGLLVVRRIDENTGRFVGTPRDVLSGGESTVWGQYAVTDGGDLVYQSWDALPGTATNRLLTIDLATRTIRPVDLVMSGRRTPLGPRYSPVNDDIAFGLAEGDDSIVAVYDVALGSHLQKSFEGRRDYPFWSPDGRYLYYHTEDADGTSLVRRRADESGTEELVREDFAAHEFSPDGRFLSGVRFKSDERTELVLVDVRSGDVTSLDSSRAFFDASFSPDGRFLVYGRPTATGQSLVVRSVSGQGRYEIPNLTARGPRWSPDGKYIYFLSGGIRRLPVRTSPGFQVVGNPELVASTSGSESFDLNRDGTKIVVSARDAQFRMSYQTPSVIWLQNWSAHLQREMSL